MAARIVQIYLPEHHIPRLETILPRHARRFWRETLPGDQEKYTCIVQQRYTERLLAELDAAFGAEPSSTAHVGKLEAVLPRIVETPTTELRLPSDLAPPTQLERFFSRDRLSTDELYDEIEESVQIRPSVRRQNIWRNSRHRLAESGPRLRVGLILRPCGVGPHR